MINLTVLAATLLALRLVSVYFLGRVLLLQVRLLRQNHRELSATRKILFVIVLITFAGNFVPILIDTAALVGSYVRNHPPVLGIMYAVSNATTAAVSAIGWWFLYTMIENESDRQVEENE